MEYLVNTFHSNKSMVGFATTMRRRFRESELAEYGKTPINSVTVPDTRLNWNLDQNIYKKLVTKGDGSCLYRAVSQCFVGDQTLTDVLRLLTVFEMVEFFRLNKNETFDGMRAVDSNDYIPVIHMIDSIGTMEYTRTKCKKEFTVPLTVSALSAGILSKEKVLPSGLVITECEVQPSMWPTELIRINEKAKDQGLGGLNFDNFNWSSAIHIYFLSMVVNRPIYILDTRQPEVQDIRSGEFFNRVAKAFVTNPQSCLRHPISILFDMNHYEALIPKDKNLLQNVKFFIENGPLRNIERREVVDYYRHWRNFIFWDEHDL